MKRCSKFLCMILVVTIILPGMPVKADRQKALNSQKNVVRVSGNTRVETAIEVSQKAYKGQVDTLFLAGYSGDADALTATFMAGEMDAPLLLADKNKLSYELSKEIHRLNPKEIIILGGEAAVSQNIVDELENAKYTTRRIKGNSRIETAVNVVEDYYRDKKVKEVFVVEYDSLVDALAIGPVAAKTGTPVLITRKNTVPGEVEEFLKSKKVEKVTIVGGESTVSNKGMEELKKHVVNVGRVYGDDRIETSLKIAKEYFSEPKSVFIANGWKNADALIGGYFAGMEDGPIVLANENNLSNDAADYISKIGVRTYVLGGKAVIGNYIFNVLDDLLIDIILPKVKKEEVKKEEVLTNKKDIEALLSREIDLKKEKVVINISPEFTKAEIGEIIKGVYHYGSYRSASLGGISYTYTQFDDRIILKIDLTNRNAKEQDVFIDKEAKRIVGEIISPDMTNFEKIKSIHDYIVNNTVYSAKTTTSAHSAYAIFKEGKGVCQGYALANSRLLDEVGIESYYVSGIADNGLGDWVAHGWNLVNLDGKYYNIDTTWDDPIMSGNQEMLMYDYFLISDDKMNKDHKRGSKNLPKATDRKYEVLGGIRNPFEYKGKLYYGNQEDNLKIYSISLTNLISEKISDVRTPSLVINDDTIYFSNYSNSGYLSSMDLNGNNIQQLNAIHSLNLRLEYPYISFYDANESSRKKIDIR